LLRKLMLGNHQISDDEHSKWLSSLSNNLKVKFHVAILGGEVVGAINLTGIDYTHLRADWGFYVDPARQGEGIGGVITWRFLDHAYRAVGLNKINAEVLIDNSESINMHLRCGFVKEGVRRSHIFRHGRWHDVVLFGLHRQEWLAHRVSIKERNIDCE